MVRNAYKFKDALNKTRIRNIRNTKMEDYNCGGYALNTFSWYCPITKEDDCRYGICSFLDKYIEHYINAMLEEFSDLRVIKDISELKDGEYAIAFRTANSTWEDDFHFAKRGRNGIWYEKRGSQSHIYKMKKEDVFSECWNYIYKGKIILFAKKY